MQTHRLANPLSLLSQLAFAGLLVYGGLTFGYRTFLALFLWGGLLAVLGLTRVIEPPSRWLSLGVYVPLASLAFMLSAYKKVMPPGYMGALVAVGLFTSLSSLGVFRDLAVRRALPWLVIAVVFGMLISWLSGGTGSADPMREWFMRTFSLSYDVAYEVTHYFRKTVHFVFYGSLAWSMWRAGLAACSQVQPSLWFGCGWALTHATFDEWRQSFLAGRSGSVWDVVLDIAGMLTFVGISYVFRRRRDGRVRPV